MIARVFASVTLAALILSAFGSHRAEGATASASPTPTPSPSPNVFTVTLPEVPVGKAATPGPFVFYILGLGDDNSRKLVSGLAEQLQKRKLFGFPYTWIVPVSTWGTSDFIAQCDADPQHTVGGFVVGLDSLANSTFDRIFSTTAYTDLTGHILYLECQGAAPSPVIKLVWYSGSLAGSGSYTTYHILTTLAAILGVGSLYTNFIPQKAAQTATTVTAPTPAATSTTTSKVTTNTSTFNPSGASTGGTAILGSALTFASAFASPPPTGDLQAWKAAADAIYFAVESMHCDRNPYTKRYDARPDELAKAPHLASQGERVKAPFCYGYEGEAPNFPSPAPTSS